MVHITRSMISKYSENLLDMANMNENDIQCIYIHDMSYFIQDLSTLTYCYGLPLCHKMVLRFRESVCIAEFYLHITNLYKKDLLICYGMKYHIEIQMIMRFFLWIKYISPSQLSSVSGIKQDVLKQSEIYDMLHKYDTIEFYFQLNETMQDKLLSIYNNMKSNKKSSIRIYDV